MEVFPSHALLLHQLDQLIVVGSDVGVIDVDRMVFHCLYSMLN
jgi:hypothetical protein